MARVTTMFLRDFTVLDCAVLDAQNGLRGESLYVSAELTGTLDHQGFVLDFGVAKKILKQKIDELADHRCVLAGEDPSIVWNKQNAAELDFHFKTAHGLLHYRAPAQALTLLPGTIPSLASLTKYLEEQILAALPSTVKQLKLHLQEEANFSTEANFRYTHGLRYHDGNCQRLFHGHRNPIHVRIKNQRSPLHEQFLAKLCENAHFVAAENLVNRFALDLPNETRALKHPLQGELRYRSSQGEFYAQIPASMLIILADEPSIENIAAFCLRAVEREFSLKNETLEVAAFEGLNKGAVARNF